MQNDAFSLRDILKTKSESQKENLTNILIIMKPLVKNITCSQIIAHKYTDLLLTKYKKQSGCIYELHLNTYQLSFY